MGASKQEVESFLQSSAALAAKIAGGVGGAGVGALVAGAPGALLGAALTPVLEGQLSRLAGEFLGRQLGQRQRARAGAGALLLMCHVQEHLDQGAKLRDDGFQIADSTGRRPMDELAEHAILSMISSVDERRLAYLSRFFANLYFDTRVSRTSIATLIPFAERLTYRGMCILSVVGRRAVYTGATRSFGEPALWAPVDHIVATETFALITDSLLVSKRDDQEHHDTVLGYLDIEPAILKVSQLGGLIYDHMGLATMPPDDADLEETERSLRRISHSPSEPFSL